MENIDEFSPPDVVDYINKTTPDNVTARLGEEYIELDLPEQKRQLLDMDVAKLCMLMAHYGNKRALEYARKQIDEIFD